MTQPERRKMSLDEQGAYLLSMMKRCQMIGPDYKGAYAATTIVTLSKDDVAALQCIEQTLAVFKMFGADDYVKQRARGKR